MFRKWFYVPYSISFFSSSTCHKQTDHHQVEETFSFKNTQRNFSQKGCLSPSTLPFSISHPPPQAPQAFTRSNFSGSKGDRRRSFSPRNKKNLDKSAPSKIYFRNTLLFPLPLLFHPEWTIKPEINWV